MRSFDRSATVAEQSDVLRAQTVSRLHATIGVGAPVPREGQPAPLLAHWLCFLPATPMPEIGPDGHPSRTGSLELPELPRRMWAGSTIAFHRPLRIDAPLTRRSTTNAPVEKTGRAGRMAFVRIDHEIEDADGPVLSDMHDIVYRAAAQPGETQAHPQAAPVSPAWARRIDPDPVLLFRYSALTFNSHRIHYDRRYAIECEGYPGLVVHGPLTATLLLHELLARYPGIDIATYRFRALRPLFDTAPFFVCGSLGDDGTAQLFARDESGALCIDATATQRQPS